MIRDLFICTQNRLRSPTAEQVFATWANVETDSAGLGVLYHRKRTLSNAAKAMLEMLVQQA